MARRVRDARCSFCGKHRDQVRKLVAGPGVFICDKCVDLCNEILKVELPKTPEATEKGTSAVSPRSRIVSRRTGLFGWLDRFFSARAAQPV